MNDPDILPPRLPPPSNKGRQMGFSTDFGQVLPLWPPGGPLVSGELTMDFLRR